MRGRYAGADKAQITRVTRGSGRAIRLPAADDAYLDFGGIGQVLPSADLGRLTPGRSAFSVFLEVRFTSFADIVRINIVKARSFRELPPITYEMKTFVLSYLETAEGSFLQAVVESVQTDVFSDRTAFGMWEGPPGRVGLNTWASFAMTYDGNGTAAGLHAYINGDDMPMVRDATQIYDLRLGTIMIGGGYDFVGGSPIGAVMDVDNFAMWKRALTADEVARVHANPMQLAA